MMGGWKTWAAAGGLCLLGLVLIGIGHKVEKNAAANLTRLILGSTDNKEPQP